MRKRKGLALACLLLALMLTGCGGKEKPGMAASGEADYRMMYLPYGRDEELEVFVGRGEDEGVYHAQIPGEALYDEEGNPIGREELQKGDYVDIWGEISGAEIAPRSFERVERMQRTEERGTPEEIEEWLDLVYRDFWQDEGYGTKPELGVEYVTGKAAAGGQYFCAAAYDWAYQDSSGEWVKEEKELPPLAELEGDFQFIVPLEADEPGFHFYFHEEPLEITVRKYAGGDEKAGEELTVEEGENGVYLSALEDGASYLFTASWDMGGDGKGTTAYLVNVNF